MTASQYFSSDDRRRVPEAGTAWARWVEDMFRICGEMIEAQWRLVRTAMSALAPAADVVGGMASTFAGAGLRGGTEAANAAQEAAQRERRITAQLTEPVKRFVPPPGQSRVDVQDLTEGGIDGDDQTADPRGSGEPGADVEATAAAGGEDAGPRRLIEQAWPEALVPTDDESRAAEPSKTEPGSAATAENSDDNSAASRGRHQPAGPRNHTPQTEPGPQIPPELANRAGWAR